MVKGIVEQRTLSFFRVLLQFLCRRNCGITADLYLKMGNPFLTTCRTEMLINLINHSHYFRIGTFHNCIKCLNPMRNSALLNDSNRFIHPSIGMGMGADGQNLNGGTYNEIVHGNFIGE